MRYFFVSIYLLMLLSISGCAYFGDKDPTLNWSAQRLYTEAKKNMDNGNYQEAIDYYEILESRYPFGNLATQSLIDVAYAHYKNGDVANAVAAADRFIKLHPKHPRVDYAYFLKGLVYFNDGASFVDRVIKRDRALRDSGSPQEAFQAFGELVRRFPSSKYSEDASKRMVYLRNVLARHELLVAEYYLRRGAYVAAINRSQYILENFETTPSVADALVVMAKSYKAMNIEDLFVDTMRVLALNYPDNDYVKGIKREPGFFDAISDAFSYWF